MLYLEERGEKMKQYYDGFPITDDLCKAMERFGEKFPERCCEVEAIEEFLEKEGFYSKKDDGERND